MKLLKNAYIITLEGEDIHNGYLAYENGRICEIGDMKNFLSDKYYDDVIDLGGKVLSPGFVDGHCHVGMWDDGIGAEGEDGNEDVDPITPQLRAIDGVNSFDRSFMEAREAGVTTVVTGPGSSNVVGGQFVAMKTKGNIADEMVIKNACAMKIALGENPKMTYGEKDSGPVTRMGTAAALREILFKTKKYSDQLLKAEENEDTDEPEFDIKLDSLVKVVRGEMPVKIHVHRADDIVTAVRICEEFSLKYTLEHATEGYMICDFLKKKNVKVIAGPLIGDRSKPELSNYNSASIKQLFDADIETAIMTDHPEIPINHLALMAQIAEKAGVSREKAHRAITITPAELCGISERVGSLKVGKDADFIITDRHPIDFYAKIEAVYINGEEI